jgi:hypothetical protein
MAAALALVMGASAAQAQSRDSKADPISGQWSGEFVVDGNERAIAVSFELKFDGKSAVTGTFTGLPSPGEVKTGTFDAKTGAFKLQLGKQGEDQVRLWLDGTLAKGVASGRLSREVSGTFTITKKA